MNYKEIEQLKKEAKKVFKELLKKRKGFPLFIVYGVGETGEQTLNVAHVKFLNENPMMKDKIVEVVKIWAEGKNPQCEIDSSENTVNIEDTKDNLIRNDKL